MEYILIFISAIFVNNIVLSQFLGICPFLGVSKKIDTSLGMSAAVAFVLTLATIVTWLVQKYVLDAFGLQYLQTIAFILVIASLVQMVEIVLKKVSPALYQALGIFLPLITTNCAVLGVAILVIRILTCCSLWSMHSLQPSVSDWHSPCLLECANSWNSPKYQRACRVWPSSCSRQVCLAWPLWASRVWMAD